MRPTFSTRYSDDAPKIMPMRVPTTTGSGVSSRSLVPAGMYGSKGAGRRNGLEVRRCRDTPVQQCSFCLLRWWVRSRLLPGSGMHRAGHSSIGTCALFGRRRIARCRPSMHTSPAVRRTFFDLPQDCRCLIHPGPVEEDPKDVHPSEPPHRLRRRADAQRRTDPDAEIGPRRQAPPRPQNGTDVRESMALRGAA